MLLTERSTRQKDWDGKVAVVAENKITDTKDEPDKTMKKTRRGKKIRRKLEKFKAMYVNIRGVKSKIKSLQYIIKEQNPTLIALAEKHYWKKTKKSSSKDTT